MGGTFSWSDEARAAHSNRMAAIWEARRNGQRPYPRRSKNPRTDAAGHGRGHAAKPGGWKEAKEAGKKTYLGLACAACGSEVRLTFNCACYTCDLAVRAEKAKLRDVRKAKLQELSAERKKERSLQKETRAQAMRERAEERMLERQAERAARVPLAPISFAMARVNYGGDPVLGLNDNSYPDEFPYNISLTKPPAGAYRSQIGCAAAQCADSA